MRLDFSRQSGSTKIGIIKMGNPAGQSARRRPSEVVCRIVSFRFANERAFVEQKATSTSAAKQTGT
jgi:hypothetical protein